VLNVSTAPQSLRRKPRWQRMHGDMLMLLCLCIIVHMLGVPMTLLNPGGTDDTLAVSAYEGLSVPSTLSPTDPFSRNGSCG